MDVLSVRQYLEKEFFFKRQNMEMENILFAKQQKNEEGKGGKYLEKENIVLFVEEKKIGER